MGEVYEAEDLELSAHVALKTILPEIADQPAVIERFRAEVLRARSVSHANVCRVYDLFAESTSSGVVRFLTMELLDGETLASRLEREGAIPFKHAPRLIAQMAAALDAAHERGVIHRDFKPGNIMLVGEGPEPRVVVSDFGIAHEWTASASGIGSRRASDTSGRRTTWRQSFASLVRLGRRSTSIRSAWSSTSC